MSSQAAVIVVSDRAAAGERLDRSGPSLVAELQSWGYHVAGGAAAVVPDELEGLRVRVAEACADPRLALLVTTGGTGVAARDVTPEACRPLFEKELPGFGERMRAVSIDSTPLAVVSRGAAGVVTGTLVLNLPGSPRGALECLRCLREPIRHVVQVLAGEVTDCAPGAGSQES